MNDPIVSVSVSSVDLPLVADFITSRKIYSTLPYVIIEVTSRSGKKGYGEARESVQITGETIESITGMIKYRFAPKLKGMNPFDIERIHHVMNRVCCGNTAAKSAVDLAMYDLMGKISHQPVCRLMGGRKPTEVETSKAIGVGKLETVVKEAESLVAQGFSILKIKTGVNPEEEIRIIRGIRQAVGPDIRLKLDANQGWTLRQAVKVVRAVEDMDIEVVEQPLPAWDLKGSAQLRQLIAPPVMLDEGIHSPSDVVRIIAAGAADMINIKLIKTGGLYPAQAVNAVSEAAGLVCQIGSLDTSIGSAAAAHFAMAKYNVQYAEIVGPLRLKQDAAEGITIAKGKVSLPEQPGFGISVDTDIFK